jgi:predicted metal-binding membrane protein
MSTQERRSQINPSPVGALKLSIGLILACLVGLATVAWVLTARQSDGGSMAPGINRLLGMSGDSSMGMEPMAAPVFIGMWVTMMVAMMFPSVAPMVVAHWRLSKRRNQGPMAVPTFVGGYLLTWSVLGVGAYWAYRGILAVAPSLSTRAAAALAGGALMLSGVYQLSKLKSMCLRHCRSPLEFFMHWKPGVGGAARMGTEHGLYCVGCCWGLMVVLFVVGLMNLAWMGLIAAVIFVEKVAPFGRRMARGVGVALIGVGGLMILYPAVAGSSLFGG